jgi:DNA-binding beta-propeller fold protein YncE
VSFRQVLILIILLTGCSGQETQPIYPEDQQSRPSWPGQPDRERIRYLYSIESYNDLGLKLPFSKRFRDFVGGGVSQSMVRPYTIALDEGLLTVADPGNGVIHLFNSDRKRYERIDRVGDIQLNSPVGVALADNRIFIADSSLNQVYILNRSLKPVSIISELNRPTSVVWDETTQRLFVAETHSHRIQVYDKDGGHLFTFGKRGVGPVDFNFPTHMSVKNGQLFVNDTMNFRIQIFDTDGSHVKTLGAHGDTQGYFSHPKGVAVDSQENVYVAEALRNRIQIFDQNGIFLMEFGTDGTAAGEFSMPAGLVIFKDRLYVCDSRNGRIQVFEYLREE